MLHTRVAARARAAFPHVCAARHMRGTATAALPTAAAMAAAPARPAHHAADGTFVNPWASYVDHGPFDFFTQALPEWRWSTKYYALPRLPVDWAGVAAPTARLQALWVGHVTFLVQAGGVNVLTDPVFGGRASPVSFAGPKRFTPPACEVEDLPPIHAVTISHNHYDHLCAPTIARLLAKEQRDLAAAAAGGGGGGGGGGARAGGLPTSGHAPFTGTTFYVPLGVGRYLRGMGVGEGAIVEMDWGDSVPLRVAAGVPPPTLTCVPAQHQSARTLWDRNSSLWAGFVVKTPGGATAGGGRAGAPSAPSAWYFSGDTGYRAVPAGAGPGSAAEAAAPRCPAFADIGAAHGPFDLAFLPIGAYSPRTFMSSFHASPEDAVEMHADVRAARSVGMHWGAFPLTDEPVEEPPARLAAAAAAKGLAPGEFTAPPHGSLIRGA
jgi:N-acyl-phosphatidylethanolamine-hydrolysing phospholipase D